jgi:DNA-binding phage protein
MSWKDTVTDPDELKVLMALDGPTCTWRTMSAVARETGLSEPRVAQILVQSNFTLTCLSEVRSITGQRLVGLIEKVGA